MNGSWPGTIKAQWYREHTQLILIPQTQSTLTITGFMCIIWFSEQNTTFQKKSTFAFSGEKETKHLLHWIYQKELHLITGQPLCLLFCSTWNDGHSSLIHTSITLSPSIKKKKVLNCIMAGEIYYCDHTVRNITLHNTALSTQWASSSVYLSTHHTDSSCMLYKCTKTKLFKRKSTTQHFILYKVPMYKMCNMFAIQQPNSSFNQSWVWFRFPRKIA